MEYDAEKREIHSDKILNGLDKLVVDFTNILEKHTDYVIVFFRFQGDVWLHIQIQIKISSSFQTSSQVSAFAFGLTFHLR